MTQEIVKLIKTYHTFVNGKLCALPTLLKKNKYDFYGSKGGKRVDEPFDWR